MNTTEEQAQKPIEHRAFIPSDRIELRAADGDKPQTLIGYAAVFNSPTDLGWYTEQIEPGAFSRSLADGDDVRALADHDSGIGKVLGRRSAGTLRLEEDRNGLRVEIDLPNTTTAADLLEQLRLKNVDGMSFGFRTREDKWNYEAEPPVRTIMDAELIEVSVVTFPAYADTSIAKRSLEHAKGEQRDNSPPTPTSTEVLRLRARARRHK